MSPGRMVSTAEWMREQGYELDKLQAQLLDRFDALPPTPVEAQGYQRLWGEYPPVVPTSEK